MNLRAAVALATACVATSAALTPAGAADHARERATCFGKAPTGAQGTSADDVIIGGGTVYGYDGDDLICDAQVAYGGDGDDRIQLTDGGSASGQAGKDEFVAISTSITGPIGAALIGGIGADVFWGSPGPDTIYGGAGNDSVRAGGGNDSIDLSSGNDVAYGDPGDDHVWAGVGNDRVDGGTGRDTVYGQGGRNRCFGVEVRDACRKVTVLRQPSAAAFDSLRDDLAEDGIRLD